MVSSSTGTVGEFPTTGTLTSDVTLRLGFFEPTHYNPAPSGLDEACFLVADGFFTGTTGAADGSGDDTLVNLVLTTGNVTTDNQIGANGATGASAIEASGYDPNNGLLYAVDGDELGTIDTTTGVYTAIGSFGSYTINGGGSVTIEDVDGIAYNPVNSIWYGVERVGNEALGASGIPDRLFAFDPTQAPGGLIITGHFGGADYIEIDPPSGDVSLSDIDDMTFNPVTGQLLGIANIGGSGTRIVVINPTTGDTLDLGEVKNDPDGTGPIGDVPVLDMEGIAYSPTGGLYGVTGQGSHFYEIALSGSGGQLNATLITRVSNGDPLQDFESLTCNTQPVVEMGDTIWFDTDGNGAQNDGEVGVANVVVNVLAPDGSVAFTTATDGNGHYHFSGLPTNTAYTIEVAAANFISGNALDSLVQTGDPDNILDNTATSAILDGTTTTQDFTLDFGFTQPNTPPVITAQCTNTFGTANSLVASVTGGSVSLARDSTIAVTGGVVPTANLTTHTTSDCSTGDGNCTASNTGLPVYHFTVDPGTGIHGAQVIQAPGQLTYFDSRDYTSWSGTEGSRTIVAESIIIRVSGRFVLNNAELQVESGKHVIIHADEFLLQKDAKLNVPADASLTVYTNTLNLHNELSLADRPIVFFTKSDVVVPSFTRNLFLYSEGTITLPSNGFSSGRFIGQTINVGNNHRHRIDNTSNFDVCAVLDNPTTDTVNTPLVTESDPTLNTCVNSTFYNGVTTHDPAGTLSLVFNTQIRPVTDLTLTTPNLNVPNNANHCQYDTRSTWKCLHNASAAEPLSFAVDTGTGADGAMTIGPNESPTLNGEYNLTSLTIDGGGHGGISPTVTGDTHIKVTGTFRMREQGALRLSPGVTLTIEAGNVIFDTRAGWFYDDLLDSTLILKSATDIRQSQSSAAARTTSDMASVQVAYLAKGDIVFGSAVTLGGLFYAENDIRIASADDGISLHGALSGSNVELNGYNTLIYPDSKPAVCAAILDIPYNTPPVITSPVGSAASISLPEGETVATDVDANDLEDGDETNLTYSLSGTDATLFSINTTGELTFNSLPDFDAPADNDADNVYELTVTVTDSGGATDTQSMTVTITDRFEDTVDTDGDTIQDDIDIDDDNDGILDTDEQERLAFATNSSQIGGVANPANAEDVLTAEGSTASSANSARVAGGDVLTLTFDDTLPAGTIVTLSLARDTRTGNIDVSDGTRSINFDDFGTVDQLAYYDFEISTATNTLTFTRNAGRTWVDGIRYTLSVDTDGDGIPNALDLDSDNDGISDLVESGQDASEVDTNNDGMLDGNTDIDNDGLLEVAGATNPTDNDTSGAHATDGQTPLDSDTDGIADVIDLDSDNDSIADTIEARPTAGYVANDGDVTDNDTDGDGIIALFDANDTTGDFGGNFVTPENTDGDTLPDYLDLDTDNDSLPDANESGLTLAGIDANGDGIDDDVSIAANYAKPDGVVNNPFNDLALEPRDTSDVAYRIVIQACQLAVTTTTDSDNAANNSGSLRDAIECANKMPGADTITFNIPNTEAGYTNPDGTNGNADDYWVIQPLSPLPSITDQLVIAGDTQPGYSNTPLIEIDGSNAGNTDGLLLDNGSDGSTLRGLSVKRFRLSGIALHSSNHTINNNTLADNNQNGITVIPAGAINNSLSANHIYANHGLGIDLGNDGVTLNDADDSDSGSNALLNFPILQQAVIRDGNLSLRGCAPAGATIELFEADVSIGGAASPGDNRFGLSHDYGEGQAYLSRIVEGSAADTASGNCIVPGADGNDHSGMNIFQFSIPVPTGLTINDHLTASATLATVGTSEFSPTASVIGDPSLVGGGNCSTTGGTDILFVIDNSNSVSTSEYANFQQSVQTVATQLLADNPANRIAVAHFGGSINEAWYVYIERDFSGNVISAPIRQFGRDSAYSHWSSDHLASAVHQLRYALDGNAATTSNYIVSPIKETSRNLSTPLQIVLMTDAVRNARGSVLIDPPGTAAEPNDGSDFTVYNELKAEGVVLSVVSFNPNTVDIAASAAIASVGGSYTGIINVNPADPEGSQTIPRRLVPVTTGFQLSTEQVNTLIEGTVVCGSNISGTIFEDLTYGGGHGRAFGNTGTIGLPDAIVEVYDASGSYITAVTSDLAGRYQLPDLPNASYYLRVVNSSIRSSRTGSNGSELPVITYRSNGVTGVLNEIGGRNPAVTDAPINTATATLDTNTFIFNAGALLGQQAQSIQAITLTGSDVENVDFGFNFNTVVNTNDSGQGSLAQFIHNNNILDGSGLQQTLPAALIGDYDTNDTVAVLMIPPNLLINGEAIISPVDELRIEQPRIVLDGRVQRENIGSGAIHLQGDTSRVFSGIRFNEQAGGSIVRNIVISQFGGSGIDIYGTGSTSSTGIRLEQISVYANQQYGVLLQNNAAHNQIVNNTITGNQWAGIASDTTGANTFSRNSLFENGGLGIDLGLDGVTINSNTDSWLNYPEVDTGSTISSNGSRIVSYDFDLEVPANTHGYRLEFFSNNTVDPSGHGEGLTYLGYQDIASSGSGLENFKGSLNANQTVPENANIAVTLTEKLDVATLGKTSEFSGIRNGNISVCTDLLTDPNAPLPNITIDEHSTEVSYLEALDAEGHPITYIISGGVDANQFIINPVPPSALFDCLTIEFISDDGLIGTRSQPVSGIRVGPPPPPPGNYEAPVDSDGNNIYDLIITAIDMNGQQVSKPISVIVQNVNEQPRITNNTTIDFVERQQGVVVDLEVFDPDTDDAEGSGIRYSISGGVDAKQFTVEPETGELFFRTAPDFDRPVDTNADNVYELTLRVADDQGYASSKNLMINVLDDPDLNGITLRAKALLQGAYVSETGLMHDKLRSSGILPVTHPYADQPFNHSGTEQINLDLALLEGNDAVVDWVLLELRATNDWTQVLASKAALLQRDGNIVDAATGSIDLHFPTVVGDQYYLSLRHRNHLDVMTATPIVIANGADTTTIDFSQPATAVLGDYTRLSAVANDSGDEVALLWSGDVNQDQRLIINGQGHDLNPVLTDILIAPENTVFNSNYKLTGYHVSDLNMDGETLFLGPENDANILLGNIFLHPDNETFAANYIGYGSLAGGN